MELKYRGVTYQQPSLKVERQGKKLIGKYRGQDCYHVMYDTSRIAQSHPRLMYRGVAYGEAVAQNVSDVQQKAQTLEKTFKIEVPEYRNPIHSSRHQVLSELDKVHTSYLMKNLEKRLNAARAKGDQMLVSLLEQEKQELA